jgi:hypothetical protein
MGDSAIRPGLVLSVLITGEVGGVSNAGAGAFFVLYKKMCSGPGASRRTKALVSQGNVERVKSNEYGMNLSVK